MKFFPKPVLLVAGFLLLAGCKSQEEPAAEAAPINPLLSYVSAESPYLLANLEPTPPNVVDAYLARLQPTFDLVQTMLDDLHVEIHTDGSDNLQEAALLAALVNELDGKLNREGLESLGLSLEAHKAFHAMGLFPVVRIALRDADALRAAIARVETAAGMNFPALQAGDISYWRLTDRSQQGALYIALLPDHLAISLFPPAMESELLPEFLGQAAPAQAFDANRELAEMNRAKGFLHYGSGYMDLRKFAAQIMQLESRTNRGLRAAGQGLPINLDPVCTSEINDLIDRAPRMVLGATELNANEIGVRYQLELENGLAGQLARLVSDVPPADDSPDHLVSMSLAMQLGRVRAFLLEKATEHMAAPFQCPQLQELNMAVREGLARLNNPMPPFVGNINGFRLQLDSLDFANPGPENARGAVVLEIEKPQMLVGSAQMFVPGLDGLEIEPGSGPVEVPQELMTIAAEGMHLSAAMSKDALGISLGKEQQAGLMDFLEADGANEGTFFSVSYDLAAQMEMQNRIRKQWADDAGHGQPDPEAERAMAMMRELQESYRDMLGQARLELRFGPEGFEVYNRMTFK